MPRGICRKAPPISPDLSNKANPIPNRFRLAAVASPAGPAPMITTDSLRLSFKLLLTFAGDYLMVSPLLRDFT